LLQQILGEQRQLSAVEQFAAVQPSASGAKRTDPYRALLPATPPGPGQQYAFEVDLDRCSGCKACVAACHALNGLDEDETWRSVGLLIGGTRSAPVLQHVTAACHHCLQPACMTACPVNAYEKDLSTGIVKHLDDQCIGCQYCTFACPYEVPRYHPGKGIVRKCDMCSSRLAVGEAPACVQSCPHEAISIKVVHQQQVIDDAEAANFLPAAPDPQSTLPATTYKSRKVFPRNLLPVDYYSVSAQHAHLPLVFMLVLTQLSVGAFLVGLVLERALPSTLLVSLKPLLAMNALGIGLLALGASVFHLGRPLYAFRAVLGLGHSWLSREIVAFGIFAGFASAYAGAIVLTPQTNAWSETLGVCVGVSGLVAVFCSIMIYVVVRRELWSFGRVATRFLLTTAVLGIAVVWLSILIVSLTNPSPTLHLLVQEYGTALCLSLISVSGVKLTWEATLFRGLLLRQMTPLKRSALLMSGELANIALARFAAGIFGGVLMPLLLLSALHASEEARFVVATSLIFLACLVGEVLERYLFFTACAAPRMPGSIR
jgi:Fe-S-cluster-containing dehydrogenase component/DMSO reductase anchor subunit